MQRINDLNNKIQPIAKSPTRMPSDYLNMLHSNLSQHAPVDEQKLYKSPQQSRIQQSQLQTQVKSEATYQHSQGPNDNLLRSYQLKSEMAEQQAMENYDYKLTSQKLEANT